MTAADVRTAYAKQVPLSLTVGAASVIAAPILFIAPHLAEVSALSQALPIWAERLWAFLYFLGGLALVIGILRLRPAIEAAGCALLSGTVAVQIYAIASIRGPAALTSAVTLGLALGFAVRATVLFKRYSGARR
jgi:hypothetical protein